MLVHLEQKELYAFVCSLSILDQKESVSRHTQVKTSQLRFINVRLSAFFLCHDYPWKMARGYPVKKRV
ncbi:MAG: hypothetical protein IJI13_07360, partial [Oscillospiraceae bacterium]|nr:hypothetical protein [Oscillospiraceae bacterium]